MFINNELISFGLYTQQDSLETSQTFVLRHKTQMLWQLSDSSKQTLAYASSLSSKPSPISSPAGNPFSSFCCY